MSDLERISAAYERYVAARAAFLVELDRLTFRAYILGTGSESFRLRASRTKKGGARTS